MVPITWPGARWARALRQPQKAATTTTNAMGRARRGIRAQRISGAMAASRMEMLAPETALRCVRPVVRMSAIRSGGEREVSPTTIAGTRPCPSGGRAATAPRKGLPDRAVQPVAERSGPAIGGPRARTTASSADPSSPGPSRPTSATSCLQRTADQRTSPTTSNRADTALDRPRATTRLARTRTRMRP